MGLFDQFPYTNFHELNLDWLLRMMKELNNTVENFIALNTIKYADPIQWNINTQYAANTIVVDPQTGTAYISSKAVPSGVLLTNTDYWSVIFTLDILTANKNLTLRDDGSNTLATFASVAGDWLLWNGTLYKVSQAINVNEAYVAGYNLTRYTVELFIADAITELKSITGNLSNLQTSVTSDIVSAINSVINDFDNIIGTLSDLNTTDKSNIVNAINEVISDIQSISNSFVYTTPEKFGAVADGSTDDTEAIQSAIDDAISNNKVLLLAAKYKTSTLNISNSIEICGGGTLYTHPFRYDQTGSQITDANRYFTTQHPEYYKANTFITVHSGGSWQSFVVEKVEDDKVYIKPAFYENSSDTVATFSSGALVNIHKLCFWIGAFNSYSSIDTQINNINIHDINIIGDQSGYDTDYDIGMDVRYNGSIMIHSITNSKFTNLYIDTANCNMFVFLGKCSNNICSDNILKNCINVNLSLSSDFLETGGGIATHWSQRFSTDSTEVSTFMVISNNIIENCYQGIFISAGSYINIANNNIRDIVLRGINLYSGDLGYPCRNNSVIGNILRNCNQENSNVGVINVLNAIQSRISDNEILLGKNGIYLSAATDIMVSGNHLIANTESGIYYYSGTEISIKDNYIYNGSAVASIVLYDHETSTGGITIDGNVHEGTRSANNSAISITRAKNVVIQNERLMKTNPQRLITLSTSLVELGDVLVKDCFVNLTITPTAAERNLLHYLNCITSSFTLQSNITA